MRCTSRILRSLVSLVVLASAAGCASNDAGTIADQLTTFAANFSRQALAAFLL